MSKENWTADTWYASAMELEAAASNKRLPTKVRRRLMARAEAAWQMGDFLQGISAEDWSEECRQYQEEDAAMVARSNSKSQSPVVPVQMELEMSVV